jgi:hypothetical protein
MERAFTHESIIGAHDTAFWDYTIPSNHYILSVDFYGM